MGHPRRLGPVTGEPINGPLSPQLGPGILDMGQVSDGSLIDL